MSISAVMSLTVVHLLASAGPAAELGEEVVVVAHYANGVGTSDAASAGTITRQLVEERPILRPGEVLELVPGLVITQHSGAGKANQYFLRGFNLDHGTDFQTTVDGMPVNLRTHAHGQGYTDLNFLVPELIGGVRYFKGPYFASKGDFASAGAAEIRYVEELSERQAMLTGGGSGYERAVLAGSSVLAEGHLLYGLELMHEDGPWVHPDDYRRLNAVLRYTGHAGPARWSATAMAYDGTWNATDQVPERAVRLRVARSVRRDRPDHRRRSHRYSLSGEWRQPLGGGLVVADAYAIQYALDLFSNFTYFLEDPVNGDQLEQLDRRWVFGTSGRWDWSGAVAGKDVRATLGWEGRQDRIAPVGLYHTVARRRLDTVREDEVVETSGGAYGEVEARWSGWLRTVTGLRWDGYLFDVASDLPANSGRAGAGRLSPKLSAILGPWARTELFANLGMGFHSNDARGVTTTIDPTSLARVSPVTPLVPTRGGEVGVRTELVPGVQSSLALWFLDMDSELVFAGDAGTTEESGPSRRRGLEWSTRWRPAGWLLLDLDASFSRARFTNGDRIPGAIGSAISAGATVHELGSWTASLFLRHFGPRPLVEDGSVRSSASTILNTQLAYRLGPRVRLSADVFNVLDARVDDIAYFYASRLAGETQSPGAGLPAPGVPGVHFHPAEGRSFRLGATYAF